ncbi:hypothetical protein [Daejeonella lutea]|uniref:DoxX-like family protein n=1 Tax=Daejeonella lutea TaxID=572036 RepID=A0A1T5AR48_9SPHI|nr:hypothetical protein [Daejeonella lutea]SKB37448.1 hypothetical protein SAMN05661099_0955 [Daejeonella lutea]
MDSKQSTAPVGARHDQLLEWTFIEKILFRFIFLLFSLFIVFFNNGAYPLFRLLIHYPTLILNKLLIKVSADILHIEHELITQPNGSGDTTYNYILLLFISVVAFLGCVIWSMLDRHRLNYQKLYYWLTVAVRFYLALMLINYGMVKIIKLQFPFPSLSRLSSTYGESSPMGLAWTFLGFSTGYNMFMGVAELLGILLLFRRTIALGAIIALMTTANVMAVNYFYDVPVKILSTALVSMSLYLLVPNVKRLFVFFIYGEATKLRTIEPPVYAKKWIPKAIPVLKILLIFAPILFVFLMLIPQRQKFDSKPKLPLYGSYEVNSFKWKGIPATDSIYALQWRTMLIDTKERSLIKFIDESREFCNMEIDTNSKQIIVRFIDDETVTHKFSYSTEYSSSYHENLRLDGALFGKPIVITFKKQKQRLMETGFNWINEFPNNR